MLKPGDVAPDFDLPCAVDNRLSRLSLSKVTARFVVLFFYPRDFSFICPTEVMGFNRAAPEFAAEQAELIGASVDTTESHQRWARELGGLSYPLLADEGGALAQAYGVFDRREAVALRATFILDPERVVAYAIASRSNVGRSVSETLRVMRAVRSGRLCPADWTPGQDFGPLGQNY